MSDAKMNHWVFKNVKAMYFASNSRVFQPHWLKQFDWLSMMRRQSVCSAEHECINLGQKGNLSARAVSG